MVITLVRSGGVEDPGEELDDGPWALVEAAMATAQQRGKKVQCPTCKKWLQTRASCTRHFASVHVPMIKEHHANEGYWPCTTCGPLTLSLSLSLSGRSPQIHCIRVQVFVSFVHSCPVTGKRYQHRSSLIRHQSDPNLRCLVTNLLLLIFSTEVTPNEPTNHNAGRQADLTFNVLRSMHYFLYRKELSQWTRVARSGATADW